MNANIDCPTSFRAHVGSVKGVPPYIVLRIGDSKGNEFISYIEPPQLANLQATIAKAMKLFDAESYKVEQPDATDN